MKSLLVVAVLLVAVALAENDPRKWHIADGVHESVDAEVRAPYIPLPGAVDCRADAQYCNNFCATVGFSRGECSANRLATCNCYRH